jgi:DNA polymerase III delta prime subunit/Sec-independent protein translocase protein TatA
MSCRFMQLFQLDLINSLIQELSCKSSIIAKLDVPDIPPPLQAFLSNQLIAWVVAIIAILLIILSNLNNLLKNLGEIINSFQKICNQISRRLNPLEIRQSLLQRLRAEFNKKKVDTLYKVQKIPLDFVEQPQQVGRPQLSLKSENKTQLQTPSPKNWILQIFSPFREKIIESERSVSSIYHQEDILGKLLILGNPGFGKTTELLNLAIELLDEALKDEKSPIPVIFELPEWKATKSISQWIVSQLKTIYQIKQSTSQKWLDYHQIIPLFDGLDEIALSKGLSNQIECIEAINAFLQETAYPYLVVCCRNEEYEEGKYILKELNGAICLKPLTQKKIKQYLHQINQSNLWDEIQRENSLKELVETPLFLSFFITSYDKGNRSIKSQSDLIESYLNHKINKHNFSNKISPEKARKYLNWLANKMEKDGAKEFLIENINVNYLESEKQKNQYRTISVLIHFAIYLLSVGISFIFFWKAFFSSLGALLFFQLVIVVFGLYLILKIERKNEAIQVEKFAWSWENIEKNNLLWFINIIFYEILFMSDFGGLKNPECMSHLFLSNISNILAKQPLYDPLLLSCSVPGFNFPFLLVHFLVLSPFLGFLIGFKPVEIVQKSIPNQGIKLSIQNALIYGLLAGLMCGLLGGPLVARFAGLLAGIAWGVIIGLCCGLIGGLSHGGYKAIQHVALRVVLYLNQCLPWDYATFLEQADKMKILQQVGGRYRFIHGLLRTHLAQPEQEIKSS